MHSLSEFKVFLKEKEIEIDSFNGWKITIGKDIWTMADGIFYLNGKPQSIKDKNFWTTYKTRKSNVKSSSVKTSKWRGISSRNYK